MSGAVSTLPGRAAQRSDAAAAPVQGSAWRAAALLALCLASVPAGATPVVLAGTVRALDAQPIYTPPSNSWPVVLRYYVPEGTVVAPGDAIVRIDPGQSLTQVRTLVAQIEQAGARAQKEIAELAVAAIDAEVALVDAHTALEKARIDARIPRQHVSGLDHDRYQGELERATREHALKQRELDAANAAVARRRSDAQLEVDKLEADLRYHRAQVVNSEVRAERAGVVVHGFDNRRGGRIDEGSSAGPGTQIGEVVGDGAMGVLAWALEPDRAVLEQDQLVQLGFDALPGVALQARIERIGGAPDVKAEWGDGRYFELEIALPAEASGLPLKPGMSVRIEAGGAAAGPAALQTVAGSAPVAFDGEVFAQVSAPIMPPGIDSMWQFSITQLVADGTPVQKDQVVVSFDGGQLTNQLTQQQSALKEKRSQYETLLLDLAERERQEQLATEERSASMDKAARKATQPADLIGRNDYAKLVLEREQAQRQLQLAQRRERMAAEQRRQERRLLEAESTQLQEEVDELQRSLLAMNVQAPRDGVMMHRSSYNGEKFDVGSQVWRGLAVAEIPELSSLAVRATVAERDLARIASGDPVRVTVEGGAGMALRGHIDSIGHTVRSKSRVQPVPVVDVVVVFDSPPSGLKPGQPVRVEVLARSTVATAVSAP